MPRVRSLAETYRRFGESGGSPLQARVALAVSGSTDALHALEAAPARRRQPPLVLAALHDLALSGRAPALAAAWAGGDGDAAADAAVGTLLAMPGQVAAVLTRRRLRADETGRCAVLYPAVAEAARRAGADAVGLVGAGCATGFDLNLDRVGVSYGDGRTLGDPSSPVQFSCSPVGGRPVPDRAVPPVVARIAVDPDPVDVTDPAEARWLRACLAPDQPERAAQLTAEVALTAADPPQLLRGDPVGTLPEALARVPAGVLPVVTTTWALSRLARPDRLRFLARLEEAAAGRAVAWVSVEGVGVAPPVPTLGDRPASGHSLVGVAVSAGPRLRVEVVARCWSRGRLLAWLGPVDPDDVPSGTLPSRS